MRNCDVQLATMPLLPTEVFLAVFQYAGRSDLKNARLSCKLLASVAEESLFREVVVVPHLDSLEQLPHLASHPTIGRRVQRLIYDTRTLSSPSRISIDLSATRDGTYRFDNTQNTVYDLLDYHRQRAIATVEQTEMELIYFLRAFRSLPCLQSLCIRGGDPGLTTAEFARLTLPRFYNRLIEQVEGLTYSNFETRYSSAPRAQAVFFCVYASGLKLPDLRVEGVYWSTLAALGTLRDSSTCLRMFRAVFSRENLRNILIPDRPDETYDDRLASLDESFPSTLGRQVSLTAASNLATAIPNKHSSLLANPPLSAPYVTQLESLCLTSFTAFEDELIEFLVPYSASLKSLTIQNAKLLMSPMRNTRPCWVRLLKQLQPRLQLTHVSLGGALSNGGNQYWRISKSHQQKIEERGGNSLKSRVEDFIVYGGECPLSTFALRPGQFDAAPPNPLDRGDHSFLIDFNRGNDFPYDGEDHEYFDNRDEDAVLDDDNDESDVPDLDADSSGESATGEFDSELMTPGSEKRRSWYDRWITFQGPEADESAGVPSDDEPSRQVGDKRRSWYDRLRNAQDTIAVEGEAARNEVQNRGHRRSRSWYDPFIRFQDTMATESVNGKSHRRRRSWYDRLIGLR